MAIYIVVSPGENWSIRAKYVWDEYRLQAYVLKMWSDIVRIQEETFWVNTPVASSSTWLGVLSLRQSWIGGWPPGCPRHGIVLSFWVGWLFGHKCSGSGRRLSRAFDPYQNKPKTSQTLSCMKVATRLEGIQGGLQLFSKHFFVGVGKR
jgi:hypothetical protein